MKVLVSNIMMQKERNRFDALLRSRGIEPIWPEVRQFMGVSECLTYAGTIDGWLAGDDSITAEVLEKSLPRLKIISKWGTGLDSIDLAAAKKFGIPVCNSPGAFRDAVGEFAIALILAATRGIVCGDRAIRGGGWPKIRYFGLSGKTIGVIGYGAIGQGVGARARGLGMSVVAYDPYAKATPDGTALLSLAELLASADVITLCCNQTPENYHLIDADALAQAKDGVVLCNVARGPLIDEAALVEALRSGKVGAAALDVFETEPLSADNPLLGFNNVVLSSHNANNIGEAVEYVHANTLANLFKYLGV